ncbi:lysylphosphatidylglycerol synthase transmembrane domain-containing protein [Sorangium sp. So ce124]|uniref:lysylphosphatidylglycerol synthase transmembrane domain-containing protein n=1 Tax=Sorangium sp. So ce124 TaxID=3133280 RepID=UPI003F6100D4
MVHRAQEQDGRSAGRVVSADAARATPAPARSRTLRLLVAALGYAAIAALAWRNLDRDRVIEGLSRLRPVHLLLIVAVSLAHIAARALRYHALLVRERPRDYRWVDGARIFLAGLSVAAVTPARAGDLIKAELVRRHGVSGSAGVGLVLVERALDLLVIAASIAVTGALLSGRAAADAWRGASLALLAGLAAGVAVISVRRARTPLLAAFSHLAGRVMGSGKKGRALELLEGLFAAWDRSFGSPARLAGYALLSAVAWAIEFSKLYLVMVLLGFEAELGVVFFVYPISIIAGILTLLPISEGVMGLTGVALLTSLTGIDAGAATVAVVVDRAASVLPPLCLWGAWSLFGAPGAQRGADGPAPVERG